METFSSRLYSLSLLLLISLYSIHQIFNVWCLSKLLNWNSVVWYKFETILGAAKTRFKIPWRCPLTYVHYNETSGNDEPRGGPSKFFVTGSKLKLKVQRLKCYIDTLTTNNYTNDKIDRNVKTYDLRDWPILQIALALSITLYLLQQFHTGRLDLPIAPSHIPAIWFAGIYQRGVLRRLVQNGKNSPPNNWWLKQDQSSLNLFRAVRYSLAHNLKTYYPKI